MRFWRALWLAAFVWLAEGPSEAAAQSPQWRQGSRVLGQWSDAKWYPAEVSDFRDGRYFLRFYDGDTAWVGGGQIRQLSWQQGQRVECNWKNQGRYYPGRIGQIQGPDVFIQYDDGDREQTTITRCRSN